MHIYRFFQPHHNPRLLKTPLRQLEISELEQAASELRKAVERSQQRAGRKSLPPIMSEHFIDLLKALRFVEHSLQTLCDAHPGDSPSVLLDMILERRELAGWEAWTSLLEEQLVTSKTGQTVNGQLISNDLSSQHTRTFNHDEPELDPPAPRRVRKAK